MVEIIWTEPVLNKLNDIASMLHGSSKVDL